jgi:UDP-GlcNAc:undecaprenyl-phosphate GlcNAc-1-phosphate transferase
MTSLLPFAVALAASLLLTPLARVLARRAGFIDRPAARKVHREPIPLGGGIALTGAVLAGAGAAALAGGAPFAPRETAAVVGGLVFVVLLGLLDDARPLPPLAKLMGQLVAAVLLVVGSGHPAAAALGGFGVPLAVLVAVALMNACNFLDNMDGILGGIALVCGLGFLLAAHGVAPAGAVLAAATAGAAAGFLAYNFHPARIFMGDAGSLAIGFLLAAVLFLVLPTAITVRSAYAVTLILAYPLFDLAFVTVTRLATGRAVWSPGKDHTTHRLSRLLQSTRWTALLVYGFTATAAAAGVLVARRPDPLAAALAAASLVLLVALGVRLARVPAA